MPIGRAPASGIKAKVIVLTADQALEESLRVAFSVTPQVGLDLIKGRIADGADMIDLEGATVVVADAGAGEETELQALEALLERKRAIRGRRGHIAAVE